MRFLMDNWFLIVGFVAVCCACIVAVWRFFKLPTDEQIRAVKEWLVGVVTEAERQLGHGTGALKLRQVYDLFVERFPWMAKIVSFDTFAIWVDEALIIMREMLENNTAVKAYVDGKYDVVMVPKE